MTDLATKLGAAQPGQEDDLLEELWDACPHAWGGYKVRARFRKMLDAEAWLSAVEMLVPENSWLEIKGPRKYLNIPTSSPNYWSARLSRWNYEGEVVGWGSTPALALAAAVAGSIGHE